MKMPSPQPSPRMGGVRAAKVNAPRDNERLACEIESTDKMINRLGYGLTEEEIQIVEA